jgi:hypothetical protein
MKKTIDHTTTAAEVMELTKHFCSGENFYDLFILLIELKNFNWLFDQMERRMTELKEYSETTHSPALKQYFLGQHDAIGTYVKHLDTLVKINTTKEQANSLQP